MHNRKIEKWIFACIFLKNYCFVCGLTWFTIFATFLNFEITDYNKKLVVSNKPLSLKATAISVDQNQPPNGVL